MALEETRGIYAVIDCAILAPSIQSSLQAQAQSRFVLCFQDNRNL
jgi:hypothetical protein